MINYKWMHDDGFTHLSKSECFFKELAKKQKYKTSFGIIIKIKISCLLN